MKDGTRIREAARFLFDQHRGQKPFEPVPQPFAPSCIDEAYIVQEELQALLETTCGSIAGLKIGLTTPVMQQMVGVREPISGAIFARTIHHSPAAVRRTEYVHLGIECEIAFQIEKEMLVSKAPHDREAVASAVGAAMAALELVDDRNADYSKLAAHMPSVIADNVWNAGVILGKPITEWHQIDLATVRGTLLINGTAVGEGCGSDVMGHPLEALAWLANHLARRGRSLMRGMIVMTGAIVGLKPVNDGDTIEFSLDGLGAATLMVMKERYTERTFRFEIP